MTRKIYQYITIKKIIASTIVVLLFTLLGLPYTNWWFNGDDFGGLLFAIKTNGLHDFLWGDLNKYLYDSQETSSFFGVYFRPLLCLFTTLEYKLFGLWGQGYLLFNVLVHTINSLFLFHLLSYFTNLFPAFLATLLFAFHPQIGFRFGYIVNNQYYLNLTLFFLIIFALKHFLDSNKKIYLLWAYVLFALSLLMRETGIVLPVIIPMGMWLYSKRKDIWRSCAGFFVIAAGYLCWRIYLYPITLSQSHSSLISMSNIFLQNCIARAYEWVNFLYDFFALSWLPFASKSIKFVIIGMLASAILYLFVHNTQKLLLLFLLFSTGALMWPGVLVNYSPRYLYEVEPFIILFFISLLSFYAGNTKQLFRLAALPAIPLIIFLMFSSVTNMRCREQKMHTLGQAVCKLAQNTSLQDKTVIFCAYPVDGFGDALNIVMKVFAPHLNTKVLVCSDSRIVQHNANIVVSTPWRLKCADYFTKNYISVTPITGGLKFVSSSPDKVQFFVEEKNPLGKTIIQPDGISIIFNQEILKQKPLFIWWDYEKKNFIICQH